MPNTHIPKEEEIAMLRAELEILMTERRSLLKLGGAAAVFVATLDANTLPESSYESAEMLSKFLNDLSEETLKDALELVKAEWTPDSLDKDLLPEEENRA